MKNVKQAVKTLSKYLPKHFEIITKEKIQVEEKLYYLSIYGSELAIRRLQYVYSDSEFMEVLNKNHKYCGKWVINIEY